MMADPGGHEDGPGGGLVRHIPVLLPEVLVALGAGAGKLIVDGTFGAGGYSRAILDAGAQVIALDRDPDAIVAGAGLADASNGRLTLVQSRFSQLGDHVPADGVDGVVFDVGVSSMQLDEAGRGFSFRSDGPLDMRMERSGVSAADVVNMLKAGDLARIFGFLGEEKQAGRIARAIERKRGSQPFRTTRDLAGLIEVVTPRRAKDRIHPATRVFQALRIFVNDELGELARALFAAEAALKPGGRLVVVTFHSLEDRLVKRFFQDRTGRGGGGSRHLPPAEGRQPRFSIVGKPMVAASEAEAEANPRARSAKLRAGERTGAAAGPCDMSIFGLPALPAVSELRGQAPC